MPTWELAKLSGQPTEGTRSAWLAGDGANLEGLKSSALSGCMECLCPCTMKITITSLQGRWEQRAWEAVWRWNIWQWDLAVFVAVTVSPSVVPRVPENWTPPSCQYPEPEHPPLCHSNASSPFIWEACQTAETGKETATLNWSEVDSSQRGLVWSGITTWFYLLFLLIQAISSLLASASGSVARYGLITTLK